MISFLLVVNSCSPICNRIAMARIDLQCSCDYFTKPISTNETFSDLSCTVESHESF